MMMTMMVVVVVVIQLVLVVAEVATVLLLIMNSVEQLHQVLGKHHPVPDVVGAAAPLPDLVLLADEPNSGLVAGAIAEDTRAAGCGYGVHNAGRRNGLHEAALLVSDRLGELAGQQVMVAVGVGAIPTVRLELGPALG